MLNLECCDEYWRLKIEYVEVEERNLDPGIKRHPNEIRRIGRVMASQFIAVKRNTEIGLVVPTIQRI